MTSQQSGGDAGDARAARIAELERLLFGRPDSGTTRIDGSVVDADRASALDELERLRSYRAAPAETTVPDHDDTIVRPVTPESPNDPGHGAALSRSSHAAEPSTSEHARGALRLLAAIGALALLAGALIGILTAPPAPAALDSLRSPATPVDRVRSAILRDAGLPLLADGRIIASTSGAASLLVFRAPQGTAELLRDADASLVGNELSPFGGALYLLPAPTALDRADTRRSEVCAWVVERSFAIEGRCTTLDEFAQEGLDFETERFGIRYAVAWSPAGEAELRALPVEETP
ncbi:hypothetical protein OVN18_00145 [Microcella daejeonensis]|uniref:Uncharacterized protein n=1 Tax=Microcella daejeonensis TaxID=2994971 RepID=A0A9E8MKX2_9MICO|nr:hypothetical protein [Microcella daejeonensis]WAB81478.1 hypothetical protein OVN18_00145 [Microcella daejeonensis]